MPCSGPLADHEDYTLLFCFSTNAEAEAAIDAGLQLVTGQIYAALQAGGQCDCAWSEWAADYLKHLNIILLLLTRDCPCGKVRISDSEKDAWRFWMDKQLEMLRSGELTMCAGETGSMYPAFDWAQPAWTTWVKADILAGRYD